MTKLPPVDIPLLCPAPKCKGTQFALPMNGFQRFYGQHPYKCELCGTETTYKTGVRNDDIHPSTK